MRKSRADAEEDERVNSEEKREEKEHDNDQTHPNNCFLLYQRK